MLDLGCGCGATTLALAKVAGHATGLDVSAPMLELARQRAAGLANVDWILADAAFHPFAPASFDVGFSRFGVMFFGDPIPAFRNIRRAIRPSGRLVFACWRPFDINPWMQLPLQAVSAHVPPLPRPGPEDPGPFAFANPDRVRHILTGAGFTDPEISKFDFKMELGAGRGLDAATEQAANMGPASRAMQDQPAEVQAKATAAIRDALAPYLDGGTVKLAAAVWLVEAKPG